MVLPKARDLISLARACRKAGITHFRSGDVEFTLSDEPPAENFRNKTKSTVVSPAGPEVDAKFESDGLTEEQLLFYSVQGQPESIASE